MILALNFLQRNLSLWWCAFAILLLAGVIAGLMHNSRLFVLTVLNGLTLAALYFLVASGFTLIFGLMRNVNLAHGSLYMLGAYIGYSVGNATGSWLMAVLAGFVSAALAGALMQVVVFRRMEGQELRQTLVTIGLSIVMADVCLWIWGGDTYQFDAPEWMSGRMTMPFVNTYPTFRVLIFLGAVLIGVLLWLLLNRTRVGMMIRAGVDDRQMLSASGVNVQRIFIVTFAIGAGLAGLGGVIGGTALSISPGEDVRYLLASLVVVIVGGIGSISGAAVGALLIGMAETFGLAYTPTYGVVFTFVLLVVALAFKPEGLMGAKS
jgi:branched-chain amino acid transport system permease protein